MLLLPSQKIHLQKRMKSYQEKTGQEIEKKKKR